jgi:hypothetical protein
MSIFHEPHKHEANAVYLQPPLDNSQTQLKNLTQREWVNNITEIGRAGVNWIHLAQNRLQWRDLVDMVMNLRVP